MTVNEWSLVPVRTDVPDDQVALIGCGATTGLGAALNTADIARGDTVAVIGCGGVGTAFIQGAHLAGAGRIIAVDPVASKREASLRFGATDMVEPSADGAVEQVMALTGDRGVDQAFEGVGVQALIEQAMAMTRRGGTTTFVGVPKYDVGVGRGGSAVHLRRPHDQGQLLRLSPGATGLPALHRPHRERPARPRLHGLQRLPLDRLDDAIRSVIVKKSQPARADDPVRVEGAGGVVVERERAPDRRARLRSPRRWTN